MWHNRFRESGYAHTIIIIIIIYIIASERVDTHTLTRSTLALVAVRVTRIIIIIIMWQ